MLRLPAVLSSDAELTQKGPKSPQNVSSGPLPGIVTGRYRRSVETSAAIYTWFRSAVDLRGTSITNEVEPPTSAAANKTAKSSIGHYPVCVP